MKLVNFVQAPFVGRSPGRTRATDLWLAPQSALPLDWGHLMGTLRNSHEVAQFGYSPNSPTGRNSFPTPTTIQHKSLSYRSTLGWPWVWTWLHSTALRIRSSSTCARASGASQGPGGGGGGALGDGPAAGAAARAEGSWWSVLRGAEESLEEFATGTTSR